MSKQDYNDGLDTAASIVEEMLGGTAEGETIICGIESSKKNISEEIQSQIDSEESPYCAKCNSCGETVCCPPINCQAVVCQYGEINLKDYKCFQDQWEVMFNALKELWEFDGNVVARDALNEVDKLWDKLYSKE